MYSLAHTPTHTSTYKCRDRHYMSNQTIIIYCQSGPVKIHSTNRASSPAHLCRHKLHPLELCAVQSPGVNVPALSPRSITFQGFLQATSMRFQRFLCMFQSVQACQTSKCCGGTCKLHHLAASVSQTRGRLQAKGESRP